MRRGQGEGRDDLSQAGACVRSASLGGESSCPLRFGIAAAM